MLFFNLFRAPKPKVDSKGMPFLKQVGMIVLSTTISLSLTLGVLQILDKQSKKSDRHLSAMMILSNIESFAREIDKSVKYFAFADSIGAWLLAQPLEYLDAMPNDTLYSLMEKAIMENVTSHIEHDHSAEKIFSNDISIWKNLGNFAFIDNVGHCYADINFIEEYHNEWTDKVESATEKILLNLDEYEGAGPSSKLIHNEDIRMYIYHVHSKYCWLKYAADYIRHENRKNMEAIGISEEEVIEFTDARIKDETNSDTPNDNDYYTPRLKPDNTIGIWKRISTTKSE